MVFYNKLSPTAMFSFNGASYTAVDYKVDTGNDKKLEKFLDAHLLWFREKKDEIKKEGHIESTIKKEESFKIPIKKEENDK